MHPLVVNCRARGKRRPEWDVYVGRGRCPCALAVCPHGPTGFGNPCVGEPLVAFVDYLADRMQRQPAFRAAVMALKGKRLACWCAPDDCHADILARVANGEAIESVREHYARAA